MASSKVFFSCFVLLVVCATLANGYSYLGNKNANAVVTYYNEASGAGSCSYLSSLFDQSHLLVAAAANFNVNGINAYPCGSCVEITVGTKKVVVKIVDQCPNGCGGKTFDLSPYAFSQIAALSVGQTEACWQPVSCDSSSQMEYWWKEGSSIWWWQILVWNHKVPIVKLEAKSSAAGASWVSLTKTTYNFWDGAAAGLTGDNLQLPLQLRLTTSGGEVITDSIATITTNNNAVVRVPTTKQFAGTGYSPTTFCGAVGGTTPSRTRSKAAGASKSRTVSRSKSRSASRTRAAASKTRSRTSSRTPSKTRTRTKSRTPSRSPSRTRSRSRVVR